MSNGLDNPSMAQGDWGLDDRGPADFGASVSVRSGLCRAWAMPFLPGWMSSAWRVSGLAGWRVPKISDQLLADEAAKVP